MDLLPKEAHTLPGTLETGKNMKNKQIEPTKRSSLFFRVFAWTRQALALALFGE